MSRFQLRRWPANCPELLGELAIVDTKHKDRIVRTYRDDETGPALTRANADMETWNANPPPLVMRFSPAVQKVCNEDGTIACHAQRVEPRIFDESSYADYEYQFPPPHHTPLPRSPVNGLRG